LGNAVNPVIELAVIVETVPAVFVSSFSKSEIETGLPGCWWPSEVQANIQVASWRDPLDSPSAESGSLHVDVGFEPHSAAGAPQSVRLTTVSLVYTFVHLFFAN